MNKPTYKLLQEEIEEISYTPVGFFEKLIFRAAKKISNNKDLTYEFKIPVSYFLRAELFCEDVLDATESEYVFTQHELIDILFSDFMYQAKMRSNPFDVYQELQKKSLEQSLLIHDIAQSLIVIGEKKLKMKQVQCVIARKEALRLELRLPRLKTQALNLSV